MEFISFELITALFFLSAMVLVSKFEKEISAVDKTSYGRLTLGIMTFSTFSMLSLFKSENLLTTIPFLNIELFSDLVGFILIITGTVMVVNSTAGWIPLMREFRSFNKMTSRSLGLINKVSRLSKIEARIEVLLSTFSDYVTEEFQMKGGAFFLLSPTKKRSMLFSTTDKINNDQAMLSEIKFNFSKLENIDTSNKSYMKSLESYPTELEEPSMVLPIYSSGKVLACLMFWNEDSLDVDSVTVTNSDIAVAVDILSRKIEEVSVDIVETFENDMTSEVEILETTLINTTDLKEKFSIVATMVRENSSVDYLSFIDLKSEQRYLIGKNNAVLHEMKATVDISMGDIKNLFETQKVVGVTDSAEIEMRGFSSLVSNFKVESMIVAPMTINDEIIGLFTVASSSRTSLGLKDRYMVKQILPLVTRAVADSISMTAEKQDASRIERIGRFISAANEIDNVSEVYQLGAKTILDEIRPDMVRISKFDSENSFLESENLLKRTSLTNRVPEKGYLILSLMPIHKRVKELGETVVSSKSKRENLMQEIELNQTFAKEITDTILQPVIVNGVVTAIVAVGKKDNNQFTDSETEFIKSISNLLAMHSRLDNIRTVLTSETIPSYDQFEMDENQLLRGQVRSALSGIIGSVELLQTGLDSPEKEDSLLSIIDKSARTINSYVSETV